MTISRRFFTCRYYPIALALVVAILLTACENDEKDIPNFNRKKVQIEEGKNISTYMSTDSGTMKAHLTAPSMLNYRTDSPYVEFPKGIHVDFFLNVPNAPKLEVLPVETTVDCKYSKYLQGSQLVLLRDSVVVHNKITGDSLHTQELWWDQKLGTYYTKKPAYIYIKSTDDHQVGHEGMWALQNFSKWTLYKPEGSQVTVPEGVNQ